MKADPKAKAAAAEPAAPAPSKKKTMVLILAAVVACAATGGIVFFLTKGGGGAHGAPAAKHAEVSKSEPPVFVPIEPFTVNLQPENGDQYLQTTLTLQVGGQSQVEVIKANMPLVRSRLLLLLSSKKASEISTAEGKKKLSEEIVEQISRPFVEKGAEQNVIGVYFTSFIIQ